MILYDIWYIIYYILYYIWYYILYIILYFIIILYNIILYNIILYYIILSYIVLNYIIYYIYNAARHNPPLAHQHPERALTGRSAWAAERAPCRRVTLSVARRNVDHLLAEGRNVETGFFFGAFSRILEPVSTKFGSFWERCTIIWDGKVRYIWQVLTGYPSLGRWFLGCPL